MSDSKEVKKQDAVDCATERLEANVEKIGIEKLTEEIASTPNDKQLYFARASAYNNIGNMKDAYEDMKKAFELCACELSLAKEGKEKLSPDESEPHEVGVVDLNPSENPSINPLDVAVSPVEIHVDVPPPVPIQMVVPPNNPVRMLPARLSIINQMDLDDNDRLNNNFMG